MAAALNRRPLGTRQHLQQLVGNSPQKPRTVSAAIKRPLSPDPGGDALASQTIPKRVRTTLPEPVSTNLPDEERKDKEQRRQAREAAKNEFRVKYTRAFPSWVFYFDLDQLDPDTATLRDSLASRVTQLGARVEDFFSNEITHLITNQPIPSEDTHSNKENARKLRGAVSRAALLLKSPIKLKGRAAEDSNTQNFNLVEKAQAFDMKIWNTAKLDSILERCDVPAPMTTSNKHPTAAQPTSTVTTNQRNLTRLLASERLHGTTERDPTQKRHDFRYFSKASCFVLVEDVKQELATIHALEYPIHKGRDGKERGAWPILYCHPLSRSPFIEFDERERRRWERTRRGEEDKETEKQQRAARELRRRKQAAQAHLLARKAGDLRRTVSMHNLHRQVANTGVEDFVDLDADFPDTQASANASGYLASTSAYIAASCNSVGITSTTGTTSTGGGTLRALELPANLRGRIQQQVVTSRRVSTLVTGKDTSNWKPGAMGPPLGIPERPNALLRKSRSANTLRLPKRDEGSKPGYCESCRVKFDDFEYHVRDRKHRKFAMDDSNYLQLDFVLNRVQRRTRRQYEEQEQQYSTIHEQQMSCGDYPMCSSPSLMWRGDEEELPEVMWDGEIDAKADVDHDV